MALTEKVLRLNALTPTMVNPELGPLWREIRDDFAREQGGDDEDRPAALFGVWAVANIRHVILNALCPTEFLEAVEAASCHEKGQARYRINAFCKEYGTTPAICHVLFETPVVFSRSALDALKKLRKDYQPVISICDISRAFHEQRIKTKRSGPGTWLRKAVVERELGTYILHPPSP